MVFLLLTSVIFGESVFATFSSKLYHRFSEEVRAVHRVFRSGNGSDLLPENGSMEYYQLLVKSDFERQNMKLGTKHQLLFPSEGSKMISLGNDFGWYGFGGFSNRFSLITYLLFFSSCIFSGYSFFLLR